MPEEEPLLVPTDAGPSLHWKGVVFYPAANPIEYARRKARVFSPPPRTLVFVPSVGLGYGLEELLQRLSEHSAILCVESSQEIMGCAVAHGLPRDPRLLIVRTSEAAGVREALRSLGVARFRRVVEVPLCAGYRLSPALYTRLRVTLEEDIRRYWQNRLTLIAMGSLQVRNLFSNLAFLPYARDFSALASGRPAVVAGAGPSLDDSIPTLVKLRERYVLVAADTALPALMARGLVPDLVVALEAQLANLQDFIPGRSATTLIASDVTSHPAVNRLFPGRTFFFSSRFAELGIFDRLDRAGLLPASFPALGSVGVAAVRSAMRITGGDVFLTGLDFSLPGLRTHARGTPHHVAMLLGAARNHPPGQDTFAVIAARPLVRVPDKSGSPVMTDRVLMSYRDNLRAEVGEEADRVNDIGTAGLDLGLRRLGAARFEEILGATAASRGAALDIDATRGFPAENLRSFFTDEIGLLRRAAGSMRQAAASGSVSEECRALLGDVNYAWVHFPDEPELPTPSRGFLARVGVATGYYAMRMERIGSVL
jgi:hypothetical protein